MLSAQAHAPTALVTGIAGQDGAYLAQLLISKGYQVHGTVRQASDLWRLRTLGVLDHLTLVAEPGSSFEYWSDFLIRLQPSEIYHLAANSSVSDSLVAPLTSGERDTLNTLWLLEAVRLHCTHARFFFASSAEMFQPGDGSPQDETATLGPQSPYACAKVFGYHLCQTYRKAYQVFACSGILFNHESPLRGCQFVTRKIASGLAGLRTSPDGRPLQLGNLDSRRDWGFAGEFVEAMWRMLQAEQAEDYVLATGETYSVRDFCQFAAATAGFDLVWREEGEQELGVDSGSGRILIESALSRHRANDARCRIGNPARAVSALRWQPATFAPQLAQMMTQIEIQRSGVALL